MKVLIALLSVLAVASAMSESSPLPKSPPRRGDNKERLARLPVPDGRIVGGENAAEGQFPYIVSLRWRGRHFCGGFILASNLIGTAAHCLEDLVEGDELYFSITTDMVMVNEGTEFAVKGWNWHPQFDKAHFLDLDVGVVIIDGDFFNATRAQAINLDTEDPADGEVVTVSGWGDLEENGSSPEHLQWTTVNIVNRTRCLELLVEDISENNICASYPGRDSCQGDSGGPLTSSRGLSGIVSWGEGCAHPLYPGVYAAVAAPQILSYLRGFIDGIHPW